MKVLKYLAYLPYVVVIGLTIALAYGMWDHEQPKSSGKFEMTGKFVEAEYSGTLYYERGEEHNTWSYVLALTEDEYTRVDTTYTQWLRKSGPMNVKDQPGYVYYGRESTGNWCGGAMPERGSLIHIDSPSGYTRDVTITELDTGKVYRSPGNCLRPLYLVHYRVFSRETGQIIKEGTVEARDGFEAEQALEPYHDQDKYFFQMWLDGQTPPPLPTKANII